MIFAASRSDLIFQGTFFTMVSSGIFLYWVNCKRKPFDDVRVRKALSLAVDRDVIGKLRNLGTGFEALIPPGTPNQVIPMGKDFPK
jgi:ABC-type oligopeptide transport system substrate-binding subunit